MNAVHSVSQFLRNSLRPVAAGGLLALSATAAEWPSWRGPDGQGGISLTNTPTRWSTDAIAWKLPLPGKGTSTPIVSGGVIYLTSPADGEDAVLAVDASGNLLWKTKLGPYITPKHSSLASGCNASPTTDGRGIYVYFKSGVLAALELDGSVRWKVNLTEQYGQERLFWDQGSSPVVTERNLIVSRLHDGESWVAAFDKQTGAVRWKEPRNFKAPTENNNGYTTPVLYQEGGKTAFLIWGADRLTAHREEDGKVLWSAGGFNPEGTGYWPAIATPVVVNGYAIVPVGRDDRPNQARVHGIRLGGSGDVTESHRAWKREDLGVFVTAPAVYDGRVYLLRHRGEVVCLDPATGQTLWTGEFPRTAKPYYASPVIAGNVLFAAREDGTVFTARVGDRFEILSENPLGERIIATPVPLPGRLLFRGDQHLFCVASR